MKKMLSLCIATLLACSTCVPAFAAESNVHTYRNENGGGGYAIVTQDDRISSEGISLRAGVDSEYVYDGSTKAGYWIHGNRDGRLVSEMKAYSPYDGRASVTNGKGIYDDGGWQPADTWSKAAVAWTSAGTNKANYDYRIPG